MSHEGDARALDPCARSQACSADDQLGDLVVIAESDVGETIERRLDHVIDVRLELEMMEEDPDMKRDARQALLVPHQTGRPQALRATGKGFFLISMSRSGCTGAATWLGSFAAEPRGRTKENE